MGREGSLWPTVFAFVRGEFVPIASTVIFVEWGEHTAAFLVRLSHLVPFGVPVSEVAVTDVTGMLLLLNFAVVLWFALRNTKEALGGGRPVTSSAKLVGLGTAVLTCVDLINYAQKTGYPDRTVYALPVILYVFLAPLLIERTSVGGRVAAPYAFGALTMIVHAILPAIAAIFAGTLYEVALSDGIGPLPSFVVSVLGQRGRTEFWGFSTGVVGMVWVPLVLCTCRWIDPSGTGSRLQLRWPSAVVLAIASLCVFVVMSEVLIKDGTLLLRTGTTEVARPALFGAKALLAILIGGAFTAAFLLAKAVDRLRWASLGKHLASLTAVLAAGALAGGGLALIRRHLADSSPSSLALAVLHAGGFVVAYACGRLTLALLRGTYPAVTPVFGRLR